MRRACYRPLERVRRTRYTYNIYSITKYVCHQHIPMCTARQASSSIESRSDRIVVRGSFFVDSSDKQYLQSSSCTILTCSKQLGIAQEIAKSTNTATNDISNNFNTIRTHNNINTTSTKKYDIISKTKILNLKYQRKKQYHHQNQIESDPRGTNEIIPHIHQLHPRNIRRHHKRPPPKWHTTLLPIENGKRSRGTIRGRRRCRTRSVGDQRRTRIRQGTRKANGEDSLFALDGMGSRSRR
mmetsp:Transcript_27779/g.52354  ORF Transcript_27779/g.52354 Transcript_27779/m.52354 type:complete len:240 (+) Transcript_27779:67-786(+)